MKRTFLVVLLVFAGMCVLFEACSDGTISDTTTHLYPIQMAEAAYRAAPVGSKAQISAFMKWVELCTTAEEAFDAVWVGIGNRNRAETEVATEEWNELLNVASKKWNELALKMVESATSFEDIKRACAVTERYHGTEAEAAATKKRMKMVEKMVESATTVEEAKVAYREAFGHDKIRAAALKKMDELALEMAKSATTIKEIETAYWATIWFNNEETFAEAHAIVSKKLDELALQIVEKATTIEEFMAVCKTTSSLCCERARAYAFKKWEKSILEMLESAVTVEEAKIVYYELASNSEVKHAASMKWIELAATTEEIRAAYNASYPREGATEQERKARHTAFMKWLELSSTPGEVRQIYDEARDEQEQMAALKKLNELVPKFIPCLWKPCSTLTIEDAEALYYFIEEGYGRRRDAFEKWNELAWKKAESATTLKELKAAYYDTSPEDSSRKAFVLKKWNRLTLRTVELATTLEELEAILAAPSREAARAILLKKIELSTIEEVAFIYDYYVPRSPDSSEIKIAALEKWDELALKMVESATTIKEAKAAYYATPKYSKAREAALIKWVELSTTAEEVKVAHDLAPYGSEARVVASRKLASFNEKKEE